MSTHRAEGCLSLVVGAPHPVSEGDLVVHVVRAADRTLQPLHGALVQASTGHGISFLH